MTDADAEMIAGMDRAEMTDSELEELIDLAGRDKVFDYARALGWTVAHSPPKYVWREIAYKCIADAAQEKRDE